MKELNYTLLTDGSSDRALIPILTWLLKEHQVECAIQPTWADLGRLPNKPVKLPQRIIKTLEIYPCDLLFIHRDAEKETREKRVSEIQTAIEEVVKESGAVPPSVCVVPVRMQEAWLLFDEIALRKAAGNPRGRQPLTLPPIAKLEQLSDPKAELHQLLCRASELNGRRLKTFSNSVHGRVHRLAELIEDFSRLRALPAFQAMETEIKQVIQEQGWCFNLENIQYNIYLTPL